jgi:outer membrane protein TolC
MYAQPVISLSQAINLGLANKKSITATSLDVAISNLKAHALQRKMMPQITAEYDGIYNAILPTSILPIGFFNANYPSDSTKSVQFGTKWNQSVGISVSQPLLDLSIQASLNEAKLKTLIATLSIAELEYELANMISQTYIDIYLQQAKIQTAIDDTSRTYLSLVLIQNKFNAKTLLKSELNKSKINHNNAIQFLRDAISLLIQDKLELGFLMGRISAEELDFSIDSTFVNQYQIIDKSDSLDVRKLPSLQLLELQSLLPNLQSKLEKTKHYPVVKLNGFLGANQYSNKFNPILANTWFGSSYVGVNVNFPVLFGENIPNKVRQLKLESMQYDSQWEDKLLLSKKDMASAKIKYDNLSSQVQNQEMNISLSLESIKIFQSRVKEGQESESVLNTEEANLQVLQSQNQENKKQLWIYRLNYLYSSGQLYTLWK